jgi:MFS family permease
MGSFLGSLAEAARAFRAVFGNPDLRRVELAFIGFNTAELGTWVAILVFAYEAGGAAAAGAIGVVQLIPAMIFAPVASLLGDQYRRERVLLAGYLIEAIAMSQPRPHWGPRSSARETQETASTSSRKAR